MFPKRRAAYWRQVLCLDQNLACLVEFAIVIVEARNSFDDTAMFEPSTDPILAVLSEVALSRRVA
jgi:hypothetical protein